ncbi:MAG: helix-turn-helix domain-containing protein [Reinekea sp.]|nr:helix-turn-helix domain-containing protein [Reinekea sp.]
METLACTLECPIKKVADILDGKWTTLIIRDLLSGPKRYHELQHSLDGISAKVLAERLKKLDSHDIIQRTVFDTVPPSTEYQLTEKGLALAPVLSAMADYGTHVLGRES